MAGLKGAEAGERCAATEEGKAYKPSDKLKRAIYELTDKLDETESEARSMTNTEPLRLEYIDVDQLADNPANWRRHGDKQLDALKGAITEVGWAGAMLYNERTERLIDGHARKKISKGKVPVLIGNWSEAEEKKLLATLDPLADMAEADAVKLESLLAEVGTDSAAIQAMLDGLAEDSGIVAESDDDVELKQLDPTPPPKMTWALIGIPTVRFGEIAEIVETIAGLPEAIVETTSNDG